MMELDFTNCTTKEDVEKVFDEKETQLAKEIRDLGKLREIFFEEDDNNEILKGGETMEEPK